MTSMLLRHVRSISVPLVRFIMVAALAAGSLLAVGTAAATAAPAPALAGSAAPGAELSNCSEVAGNLVVNCGFENYSNGWYYEGGEFRPIIGSMNVGADAHSGERVGVFGARSAPFISWNNIVQVIGGRTYEFGSWWRSTEEGRAGRITIGVSGPVADVVALEAPVEGSTAWAALSGGSFRATADGTVTLTIISTAGGELWLDDAALWPAAVQTYSIDYDANASEDELDGDLPEDGSFTTGGTAYTVAAPDDLSRFGFEFTGWNTKADGTGESYQPGTRLSPTQDVTLHAQWRIAVVVGLETSASTQVYRTTDPQTLYAFTAVGPEDVGVGIIRFKHEGIVIGTVRTDEGGEAAMRVPTNLPLGKTSFTAEFTPTSRDLQPAVSEPAELTIARVGTTTKVTLRQQTLSKSEQQQFKVRSSLSVSVQVVGNGTRTPATGRVAINVNGKITTLTLTNGRAKTALIPTSAGLKKVFATYRPSTDFWVRSTGRAEITVR